MSDDAPELYTRQHSGDMKRASMPSCASTAQDGVASWPLVAVTCLRGLLDPAGEVFYRRITIILWLVIIAGLAYRLPFGEFAVLFGG
jgi:hypothetical protein